MTEEDHPAWRPQAPVQIAKQRARLLTAVREYFSRQQVLEVDTPAMGAYTVTDPHIESFSSGASFLQTSPEYFMKRLLAAGYPDIYQVCKVFRDSETGRLHLPEFTMIEWYRLGFSLHEMIEDAAALVAFALSRPGIAERMTRISYCDAFRECVGLDPLLADTDELADAAEADAELRASIGTDRDAWLDLLVTDKIATAFGADELTALYHYPASQAALARRCPDNERVAERFEIFYGAVEIGNGFVELTDAAEQRERFESDQDRRRTLGRSIPAIDHRLIAALAQGLPACAGVAVGLDRLLMILTASEDIRRIATFPDDI